MQSTPPAVALAVLLGLSAAPAAAQLFVIVSFEPRPGRSLTFRRVYDKNN